MVIIEFSLNLHPDMKFQMNRISKNFLFLNILTWTENDQIFACNFYNPTDTQLNLILKS